MAMKMTDAAKMRLRELAEQQKGRKTLKGYDPYGWAAAMDSLIEGRIHFPHENLFTSRGQFDGRDIRISPFRWQYTREEAAVDKLSRSATQHMVTFVALKHSRPDQDASLRQFFGAVPIVERVFCGLGKGHESRATWVFPAAPVVRFIWAIWPGEKENWGAKAGKYLYGYTAGVIRDLFPKRVNANTYTGYGPNAPEGFMDAARDGVHAAAVAKMEELGILKKRPVS